MALRLRTARAGVLAWAVIGVIAVREVIGGAPSFDGKSFDGDEIIVADGDGKGSSSTNPNAVKPNLFTNGKDQPWWRYTDPAHPPPWLLHQLTFGTSTRAHTRRVLMLCCPCLRCWLSDQRENVSSL